MRRALLVPTLAALTCALAGIAAGLLGAAGDYERANDPDRCAIHSVDTKGDGVTIATVLTNDVGRIWTKDYYGKTDGAHYTRWYACRNNIGRHVFLASARVADFFGDDPHAGSYVSIRPQGLEGPTVAFARVTCSNIYRPTTCRSRLHWTRLDRDEGEVRAPINRRHALIDAPFVSPSGGPIYYVVEKPTLRSHCGKGCDLHRLTRHGKDRVIDSGTNLRLRSMTLAPNGDFFWRNGSEPRAYPPPK